MTGDEVRAALVGAGLLVVGLVLTAIGVVPLTSVAQLWARSWPILLFVVAITVVTELAADSGLFRVVAERLARWGRGQTLLLWILVVTLAIVCTVFLSIDTTAVLLTPVVVVLALHVGVSPIPFAMTTVWLANTASLLLPVSNLTNLLAHDALGSPTPAAFAALTAAPALVAIVVPVIILFLVFRRRLVVRYVPGTANPPEDRVYFWGSAVIVVLLLPALVSGIAVWVPASIAAILLLILCAVRRRSSLRLGLVPWSVLLFVSGLFLAVTALHEIGLGTALALASGNGDDVGSLLQFAGVSALGANIANNLPAYLAFEPLAGSPLRFVALLIGVNVGAIITPWASLATLLWHERLTALDVSVPWRRFALLGLIAAPVTVTLAVLALAFL